ncbi:uncharacterized protein CANTADRAFT_26480 [Suhomyces tanzawaensis NRRL Y-17324]|uniref:Mediator of RNA polymerase II transcription subunit 16 n=1 Tax=Suhomyces tanzawaensis NRRL Y-17324 TaxID=984487 RepID=A0A1E4SFU7_9ASCO|nr:uncharacterized protein CANTADRAFT_26480 [Suhomyces tanzawaensis NRRL Y-17324]ODV78335.1 hypothetical protein CANTADRAFT_26480 [Suhomyces tanzawaensis NRRL Y-17324]
MTVSKPQALSAPACKPLAPHIKLGNLISWSKNGFIAYANHNTTSPNLLLTYLENTDGKTWQLAAPQTLDSKLGSVSNEISLVCWSNLNTDLAVADAYGNFYILLAGVGLLDHQKGHNGHSSNGSSTSSNGFSSASINTNGSTTSSANGSLGGKSNGTANATNGSNSSPSTESTPSYELTSYNNVEMIYRDQLYSHTTTSIVAFKWLNIEKPQIVNKPATLVAEGDELKYTYGVGQAQPHGITHPISTKQACVALRQNGEFILYFQGEHKVEYHKSSLFVSDQLVHLTTSSIGFNNEKQVIIVAYDSLSNKILTYTVSIDWGFLVESAKRQKTDPHFHTPKEAQKMPKVTLQKVQQMSPIPLFSDALLEIQKIKSEDAMDVDVSKPSESSDAHFSVGSLDGIEIASSNAEKDSKPDIFIIYSWNDAVSGTFSKIYRYNLIEEQELISDAFTDLGLRKKSSEDTTTPALCQSLRLQDVMTRSGKIKSISSALNDYFVLIQYEDNRKLDVIDRFTLKIVNNESVKDDPPTTVTTIFDTGFQFASIPSDKSLVVAVSPNMTSFVYIPLRSTNANLTFEVVKKVNYLSNSYKDLLISSVGLAYRHAYSCYTNTCSDDILILIQSEIARLSGSDEKDPKTQLTIHKFIEAVISEAHKAIIFELDKFSKESVDKLLSNPPLQKLLSLQLVLGELNPRNNIMSDIAWIVLNLRSASFGIMFLLSSICRSKKKPTEDNLQDSITRGECIMSLIGNMKWLIDLMVYLNQELIELFLSKNHSSSSRINIRNSSVLPIIMSKVPRLFLMYALSSIGKTHEILKKLHKDLEVSNKLFSPMKESLNRCFTICNNSPLTLSLFENFLRECDVIINKELSTKLVGKDRSYGLKLEQKLVCEGEVPDELIPVARAIIDRHNININRDMKVSDLYFYDVEWLNVGINKSILSITPTEYYSNSPEKKSMTPRLKFSDDECIDALRKIVVTTRGTNEKSSTRSPKLRKCTRCRSLSLVSDPHVFDESTAVGLWTVVFHRTCICGNSWVNCEV